MICPVAVPRSLLIQALTKARLLYIAACEADRQDPGDDGECWAEFEALAEYVGSTIFQVLRASCDEMPSTSRGLRGSRPPGAEHPSTETTI